MNEQTRDRLKKYMAESGKTAKKLAKDIDYSQAVLSQYLSGSYIGNIQNLEVKLNAYLDLQSERKLLQDIETPFVPTRNAKTVFGVATRAQLDHKLCVVTGDSGAGKSCAVKEYETKKSSTILIQCNVTYNGKVLLSVLHKKLGLTGKGSKHSLLNDCVEALKNTDKLVIIDEADLLSTDSLELLRALHDESGVGLLLIGLPELAENLRGSKGEFARLYTRVGGHAKLTALSEQDTQAIVDAYIPGANGLHKTFFNLCRKNCRTLYLLIYNSIRVSQENNCSITDELIEKCASMLAI